MENELTPKESRDEANALSDEIYEWAEKRAGEASAYSMMLHIRGLARMATKIQGQGSRPYKTREEVNIVHEAMQDLMELFDSIRYRVEHKGEQ